MAPTAVAPHVLQQLVKPEYPPAGESLDFLRWLLERAGLEIARYRWRSLERRLPACLRALRVQNAREGQQLLARQPELISTALDALLIGVTSLFRDAEVFELLQKVILPRWAGRQPNVWSVACSNGSELYSLAMLLEETGSAGGIWRGTDCRTQAIAQARRGVVSQEAAQAIPSPLGQRYLQEDPGGYRIVPLLRDRIRWEVDDVFSMEPGAAWDIILCRNLAIYLEDNAAAELWARLMKSLSPGGLMVVGKTERLPAATGMIRVAPCIYSRRGNA